MSDRIVKSISNLSWQKALIVLAVTAGIVFYSGLWNEMVLDDWNQVAQNKLIHSLRHLPKLFIGSTFYSGKNIRLEGLYYRPFMLGSFALIYHFFKLWVLPYHVLQLSLHILNSLLLFLLLRKFIKKFWAIAAAILFVIHPINVEAVVYISNLQDVMFTFFGLLSSLVLVENKKHYFSALTWSLVLLFCSLMAKEVGVVFFGANVVYLWLSKRAEWKKYLVWGSGIVLLYIVMRLMAVGSPTFDRVIPIADATVPERLLSFPKIHAYYIRLLLFPNEMAIAQNWVIRAIDFIKVVIPSVVVIGFYGLIFWISSKTIKKDKKLKSIFGFGLSLMVLGLLIHSQFFPLDVTVADRWYYSISIGLVVVLALIADVWVRKISRLVLVVMAIIILAFGARSYVRVGDWVTGYNLYSHDYELVEDSFTLENNLGLEFLKLGEIEKARYHLERSTELSPRWGISHNNLGLVYETIFDETGDAIYRDKAISAYKAGIEYPTGVSPFINLGRVLVEKEGGDAETNLIFVNNSLSMFPEDPDLWYMKSKLLLENGDKVGAMDAAVRLNQINPSNQAQWWLNQVINWKVISD